jgi:hypothetical protein
MWLHATRRRIAVIENYDLKLNHKLMSWDVMWCRNDKISRIDDIYFEGMDFEGVLVKLNYSDIGYRFSLKR